jgi:hypothetical protein
MYIVTKSLSGDSYESHLVYMCNGLLWEEFRSRKWDEMNMLGVGRRQASRVML